MTDKNKEALEALVELVNKAYQNHKTISEQEDLLTFEKTIRNALQAQEWQPIESAPKDATLFILRRKKTPHVQFEAYITQDSDGWEGSGKTYDVIINETNEDDLLDDDWRSYEWMPLPTAPKAKE